MTYDPTDPDFHRSLTRAEKEAIIAALRATLGDDGGSTEDFDALPVQLQLRARHLHDAINGGLMAAMLDAGFDKDDALEVAKSVVEERVWGEASAAWLLMEAKGALAQYLDGDSPEVANEAAYELTAYLEAVKRLDEQGRLIGGQQLMLKALLAMVEADEIGKQEL